jgi:hypothetical protein
MNHAATPSCQCIDCPGASCRCGCQLTQASPPAQAADKPCACGPQCNCDSAGNGCACDPLKG